MKTSTKLILIILILICENVHSQIKKSYLLKGDSLFVNNGDCGKIKNDGFYKYKNLYISSKYKIIDSIEVNSKKNLEVIVLSPINQEGESYRFPCNLVVKRILLIYDRNANYNHVRYITDELILNQYDFPSDPYLYRESLKPLSKGFSLFFIAGSKVKCDLTLFFTSRNGNFYLYKYIADYYSTGLPHSKTHTFVLKNNKNNALSKVTTLELMKFPDW